MSYTKWAEKTIKRGEQPHTMSTHHKFQTFAGSRRGRRSTKQQDMAATFDKLAMACLGGIPTKPTTLTKRPSETTPASSATAVSSLASLKQRLPAR